MGADTGPVSLTQEQLMNIQGDIWSKGFPKYHETYYFFAIKTGNEKTFVQSLRALVERSPPLISTLKKVKEDQDRIQKRKEEDAVEAKRLNIPVKDVPRLPVANALIAFTRKGLDAIEAGIGEEVLDLSNLDGTDPAFSKGMASEDTQKILRDPKHTDWELLFRLPEKVIIHGMLKVAGSSKDDVEIHLSAIKSVLKHGTALKDALQNQPPTPMDSRVDGWTRPNDRGKEHFGFEDNISRPLMRGIDQLEQHGPPNMNTDPSLIIVTPSSNHESKIVRPGWMNNGSFVVFRKLEQNVKGFEALTSQWEKYGCRSKEHMGAKLVGRWQSGAPIVKFPKEDTKDPENDKSINNFVFIDEICPMSAHIRKTNIRKDFEKSVDKNNSDTRAPRTRILRSGIPYGHDYKKDDTDSSTRGLLFVCYQNSIEDGFEHMQSSWSNSETFPSGTTGHDPIIGQTGEGNLKTEITDQNGQKRNVEFKQLVTLKGGEYFFAPSINAMKAWGSGSSGVSS